MFTLAIDSNIMYIESALERGENIPRWVSAVGDDNLRIIRKMFELRDRGLIDIVLPRGSWEETLGANEDPDINEGNVHFISDRLHGKLAPPGNSDERWALAHALREEEMVFNEYNKKMQLAQVRKTAMSPKDKDDAQIMADCLVYNEMLKQRGKEPLAGLITINFRDFIGCYHTFPQSYTPSETDVLNDAGNAILQDNIRLRIGQFAEVKGYTFTPPMLPVEIEGKLKEIEATSEAEMGFE